MSEQSFMVYAFDVKVKFIQFLRAIAPVLGVEELGLKDGKMIADRVEEGTPLRIFVGSTPGLKGMLEKYAVSVGAKIQQPVYIDFHAEVRGLKETFGSPHTSDPGWGDEWDDTVIPAGTPIRETDPVTFGEWDWDAPEHPWNEAELVPVEDWDDPAVPVWDYTDEPDNWQAEKVREDHAPRDEDPFDLPHMDGDDGVHQTLTPHADAYLRNHGGSR